MIRSIMQRIGFMMLDLAAFPGILMSPKTNAKWHLKVICPLCPPSRRKFRNVNGTGVCWWNENWKKGNYAIPKNFGIKNWVRSYLGKEVDFGHLKK